MPYPTKADSIMPIRIFEPGDRPTSADFNRYFLQQHVAIKTVDESVSSSTTRQLDDELFAPVDDNTDYWVWCIIFYLGPSSGGDLVLDWDGPSGCTFDWVSDALGSAADGPVNTVSRNAQGISNTPAPGTLGTGTDLCVLVKGVLRTGASSGTLQLKWAQLSSSSTAVTVMADSTLILRRLTL